MDDTKTQNTEFTFGIKQPILTTNQPKTPSIPSLDSENSNPKDWTNEAPQAPVRDPTLSHMLKETEMGVKVYKKRSELESNIRIKNQSFKFLNLFAKSINIKKLEFVV